MMEQDKPKMAHDEMIDTLKGLVFGTFDRTTPKEREALDMAIKALEQEETIPFDFELFQAGLMNMPEGMTNGDVIKAVFPKANVWESSGRICVDGRGCLKTFSIDWWNAPYKNEVEE